MPLDLLIINPGGSHGIYGKLGDTLTAKEPPPWARMIAGYILDRGFTVKILDCEALNLDPYYCAGWAEAAEARLVAIVIAGHQPSASTQAMPSAGAVAKAIRETDTSAKIIMLGNHPSALPVQTLKEESVDYVCDGEGPITILELLKGVSVYDIPGLVFKEEVPGNKHQIVQNSTAPLIQDLDNDLRGNVWNLLPMNHYRAHMWQTFSDPSKRTPYASIYTTLGCPFKCSFCMINSQFHSNKYRRFSPDFVVSQIRGLYEVWGVETFKIADEMFILNEEHYTSICKGLINENLGDKLNIWAYARVDTVKPETLELLRSAGFQWLALGIESGSKHVRDGAVKRLRTDDIVGTVRQIQSAGINVVGNYIVGLPDDNLDTVKETYDLACECNTEWMNVYSAMAYPGSALYTQAVKEGWKLPSSWAGYSQHNRHCRPLDTQYLSGKQVLFLRDKFHRDYFSRQDYLDMMERKFGQGAIKCLEDMMSYSLPRDLLSGIID